MLSIFSTYATSIFLEGVFFLIAGVIISSLIEVFIPGEFIEKIIPENRLLGIAAASFTGLLFPVCECGIVPVAARLIKKGVPAANAVTMMLSIPIVNIVVFTSTHFAFKNIPEIAFYRTAGGIIVSFVIGVIITFFMKDEFVLKDNKPGKYAPVDYKCSGELISIRNCGCYCHTHQDDETVPGSFLNKLQMVFFHSIAEFFDTGRFFITGVLATSLLQTIIPRTWFTSVSSTFPVSELFMSGYAFILSICSQTDAFIARSFSDSFGAGALLCFMISGAMIDIKNITMMKNIFSTKFILLLSSMIIFFTITFSRIAEMLIGAGL
ncbi:MAG TPA: permease [Spirochaetota bacterium]|nr:permease [Spirochaetota bacterium]